ncbi:Ig-like domain-containing protein, partial [Kineococcus glutinatus]|uniref:Ig-like domain-containing protein n=1 Tax=Kineococcus glutinatus TaxID=1070872 RepID=UPI0031E7EFD5
MGFRAAVVLGAGAALLAPALLAAPASAAAPAVDFNADGIADGYVLENGWDLSAWVGRKDGSRAPISLGEDPYVGDDAVATATRTPDGRTVVLVVSTTYAGTVTSVLTDRGLTRLTSETSAHQAAFYGSLESASRWQDVNGDGWKDVVVDAYPCFYAAYNGDGCIPGRFVFLQQYDRRFVPQARTVVTDTQLSGSEQLKVRVQLRGAGWWSAPTGTVTFTADGQRIGGTYPVRNGAVEATLPRPAAGDHTIVARYSGDARNPAGNSTPQMVVVTAPTTTRLHGTDAPTAVGQPWTGAIDVLPPAGGDVPFGDVRLVLDGVDQGTVALDENGSAPFSFTGLSAGRHTLVATYEGNGFQWYDSS